jgi:HK97 family phage major capsid protein
MQQNRIGITRQLEEMHVRAIQQARIASAGVKLDSYVQRLLADIGGIMLSPEAQRSANAVEEVSRRITEATGKPPRGFWLPMERALNITTPGQGKELIAGKHDGQLIEALRPFSGTLQAGAQLIAGLPGMEKLVMPRASEGAGVAWIGEFEEPPEADPELDQVVIQPRTVTAHVNVSRRMTKLSSLSNRIESVISDELMSAIWAEVDRVALSGSGIGNEPAGILASDGILDIGAGTNGAAPSLDLLCDMEEALGLASGRTPNAFFTTPQARRKMRKTARSAEQTSPLWSDENRVIGYVANATTHLPSTGEKGSGTGLSSVVLGDFSQLLVGLWGPAALDVLVLPPKANGSVDIHVYADIGIGLRHAKAFAVCRDLVTAD